MDSVHFAHIAPVSHLDLIKEQPVHLLLAHLVEENAEYREFYINLKKKNPGVFYHLDNSAFEMFKRGVPMYDSNKLIKMAELVKADSIVLSDYPKQHWTITVDAAQTLAPKVKAAGFKTFFCPQSSFGDKVGLLNGFTWALGSDLIDFIGVSILACPIAYGVDESAHGANEARSDAYKLQRFLSRWKLFSDLKNLGLLNDRAIKRFHCLGMTDGPNEIELLKPFHEYIYSWDSSSAVWAGLNGISYDMSPSGLTHGKYELEVDFECDRFGDVDLAKRNMAVIDSMCRTL